MSKKYFYHVEDGQFWGTFENDKLLAKDGEIFEYDIHNADFLNEVYVLFIHDKFVFCIGNIENSFPENNEEHESLKKVFLKQYLAEL